MTPAPDHRGLRAPRSRIRLPQGLLLLATALVYPVLRAQSTPEYELPPINYSTAQASNRVTTLQRDLDNGGLNLRGADEKDTLRRCLGAFGVSPDTQVLVFSKTSLQRQRIDPRTPRALYFSDDCYLGWVPGGLTEITATDPQLGLAFYHLDPRDPTRPLRFERDADCLSCHAGSLTRNWPGLIVRSVFPDENGEPISSAGSFLIGHDSPLSERWGGWYVTGQHGRERHLGNAIARAHGIQADLDRESGANLTSLAKFFSPDRYLAADSDIVALMVLEHQVGLHNRLVEGGLRVRKWTHYQESLQKELGEPPATAPTGTARRVIESEANRILEHLLFVGEAVLRDGVQGAAKFQTAFRANRRADSRGRSLKDFDLRTRLFAYRCSYMIYSPAFEALPATLKNRVYARLREVLTAPAAPPQPFAHLNADERLAIRDILLATKPDLAAAW